MPAKRPWFSFLVHPRNIQDLKNAGACQLIRETCSTDHEFVTKCELLRPVVIGRVIFGFAPIWGEIISVARMPNRMITADGRREVKAAFDVAQKRKARVIGLGALTAPATAGGLFLTPHLSRGVRITNGNSFTAFVVRENVKEALQTLGEGNVAIVGATGSVGIALAHLLDEIGVKLTLVGRNANRLRETLGGFSRKAHLTTQLTQISDCRVIVLLTNAEKAKLQVEHVESGSVIIDCAQPTNIVEELRPEFEASGVQVRQGGLVNISGFRCTYDFRLPTREVTFACLAETYMFSKNAISKNAVGIGDTALAKLLGQQSQDLGISPYRLKFSEPA